MAKKYTKSQAHRAIMAIFTKTNKLLLDGYADFKDFQDIDRVVKRLQNRLKKR